MGIRVKKLPFESAISDKISKRVGKLGVRITLALRKGTPKDTTHASQEWVPTINVAHLGELGSKLSPKVDISSNLESLKNFNMANGDSSIHITNRTHYINELNAGSSRQAGPEFVQHIVDVTVDSFNIDSDIKTAIIL